MKILKGLYRSEVQKGTIHDWPFSCTWVGEGKLPKCFPNSKISVEILWLFK